MGFSAKGKALDKDLNLSSTNFTTCALGKNIWLLQNWVPTLVTP